MRTISLIEAWLVEENPQGQGTISLGTWELALTIAGPIVIVCIFVMVVYSLWHQHRRRQHQLPYRSEDSIEAPDHPILGGVSLRDMIEMTTSGSGSGENSFYVQGLIKSTETEFISQVMAVINVS